MVIRYYKLGSLRVLLKSVLALIISQAVLFSLIAIIRIPVGRLTIPMVLIVYMLTLIGITTMFEKQLAVIKEKEEKNKK